MSHDLALQMYDVQAQLIEMKEELKKVQKENEELRNQMAVNNLMKTVSDQVKLSESVGAIQANFNTLSTKVSNSDQILSEINETLRRQKQTLSQQNKTLGKLSQATETLNTKEKNMVDDQAKLSRNLERIQKNVTSLSASVSNNDEILSQINETLRKQNNILEKQNKDIQVLKKNIKTLEKETILLLGGRNGNEVADSLLILQNNEKNDGNWKELNAKLPYAVGSHGVQFLNNNLYIFGGQNEKNEPFNASYKLTGGHKWLNNSLEWRKITDMNEKRTEILNSSVILNDRIWVIGGYDGKNSLKSVEMYDPQTNIWTNMKPMNEYRSLAAAAVVHGKIFCCGGGNGGNISKTTECYDSSSDVWILISDMPGPNAGCGAVVINEYLIVIGGKASKNKDMLNSVWVLDTTDKNAKWIEKPPCLAIARCQFSIAKIHDKIFVCGGLYINKEDSKLYVTNNVEIFDGKVWRDGPKILAYRDYATAIAIPFEFTKYLN